MSSHAVMGVIPPSVAEARLAMRWPSVAGHLGGGPARLGCAIQQTAKGLIRNAIQLPTVVAAILLVPVTVLAALMALAAWGMLAPLYFLKVLPLLGKRYILTSRRLYVGRGITAKPSQEVELGEIDELRVVAGSEQPFYLSADLEVICDGKPVLVLAGVPEYQSFIATVQNAFLAWGRKSPPAEQFLPASEMK